LSPKVFFALLLVFVFSGLLWFCYGRYFQKKIYDEMIKSNTTPYVEITGKCPSYTPSSKDKFLDSYMVKKGDTLLSIAQSQLGDSSRVYDLVSFNKDEFPQLSLSNSYLETSWKLYLPFKDTSLPTLNGSITQLNGEVVEITNKIVQLRGPDWGSQIEFRKNTKFPDKQIGVGDCLKIVTVKGMIPYAIKVEFQ
jgi:hypothetical protein